MAAKFYAWEFLAVRSIPLLCHVFSFGEIASDSALVRGTWSPSFFLGNKPNHTAIRPGYFLGGRWAVAGYPKISHDLPLSWWRLKHQRFAFFWPPLAKADWVGFSSPYQNKNCEITVITHAMERQIKINKWDGLVVVPSSWATKNEKTHDLNALSFLQGTSWKVRSWCNVESFFSSETVEIDQSLQALRLFHVLVGTCYSPFCRAFKLKRVTCVLGRVGDHRPYPNPTQISDPGSRRIPQKLTRSDEEPGRKGYIDQLSHEKKTGPLFSIESWLFNTDANIMVYEANPT